MISYLLNKWNKSTATTLEPTMTTSVTGVKEWRLNDELHRVDGPAVIWTTGTKFWYLNNKWHRVDGPAIEWTNGNKEWYLNDKRHRTDGPAVILASGTKEWYINNERITTLAEYQEITKLSDEAMVSLVLKYGDIK